MTKLGLAALGLLAGCSPNVGAVSTTGAESDCRISCDFEASCLDQDLDTCTSDCVDYVAGWIRADALEKYAACHGALACDADDDECLVQITPLAVHKTWEKRCRAQLADCDVDLEAMCTASFDPSLPTSGFIRFVTPTIVEKYVACLDEADCTARVDCITAVSDSYGVDF